ncbi:MAG: prepilin-type N-terminal cleavage/methylation domain-containing protein [Nitrospirota bacterium]|nr:prepilin-type N-terminal cleavage/methylation domain-containing protein [Nitrospirota bacterium]
MTPLNKNQRGFTLLELMIVIAIVGILVTLAVPSFRTATIKAREAVLKEDLYVIRSVIDQYYADNGTYPPTLQDLVAKQYLRSIPIDPFTSSASTWEEVIDTAAETSGVFDVKSGSDKVGLNGVPYREW